MLKSKKKSTFFCTNCGYENIGYIGKCPGCAEWNSFKEAPSNKECKSKHQLFTSSESGLIKLDEIKENELGRFDTKSEELNRVFGAGIVPGSLTLIGGEPGIGKSTILLQVAANFSKQNLKVLYISAEESSSQLKLRANRLGIKADISVFAENNLNKIIDTIANEEPSLVIVDSIQAIYLSNLDSVPGSPSQIRDCTGNLMRLAKSINVAIILVGHINKEGDIAGPKILEHMVDTVLYFEGSRDNNLRLLRCIKNRFGSTDEIAIFSMEQDGLKDMVNPSLIFLEQKSGGIIFAAREGKRCLLIELQALVNHSEYNNPRRLATGIELNRLHQILAVLEKKLNLSLAKADVYLNVVGGINIKDTACDLAIALSIYNNAYNKSSSDLVALGEIGLSGEIRTVHDIDSRLKECRQLGLKRVMIPAINSSKIKQSDYPNMELIEVNDISEAVGRL
jgi:DNA repair protein RadA/Sms